MALNQKLRKVLSKHKEIVGVYRFGTRKKHNKRTPFSDIDYAFVLEPYDKYVAADISLSFPPEYDISILAEAPPFIVEEVVKKGNLIYVRDKKKLFKAMMSITADLRRNRSFLERMGVL